MSLASLRRRAVPLLLAAALAVLVVLSAEWGHRAARQSQQNLIDRARHLATVQTVLQRMVDAETAQRGYLLTGRGEYLEPYRNADADVLRGLAEMGAHFGSEADSRAALDALGEAARERLTQLATTIAMHDADDHLGWKTVIAGGTGKASMDRARVAAATLLQAEQQRIDRERAVIVEVLDRSRLAIHATTLLALIWLIFFLRKQMALQRAQAEHAQDLRAQRDVLEQQVVARTGELRELNAHLQDVREAERTKLARVLHDEMGSLLTAAKLDLARLKHRLPALAPDAAQRLEHLGRTLGEGVALKRRIIEELSPSALHNLGLRAALEILVADFRRASGIAVDLETDDVALSDSPRIIVYRLVQECLDNLHRHGDANTARVSVRAADEHVLVKVSDTGRGFDPSSVPVGRHGLRKLRHRIEAFGGRLRVTSAPGRGTEVEASLPLHAKGWDVAPAPA